MTNDQLNAISLAITIPSFVVLLTVMFSIAVGVPPAITRRRRERQRAALIKELRSANGDDLQINWTDYKYLPKQQLMDVAGEYGWNYVDQWHRKRSWFLRFSRLAQNSVIVGNTRRKQPTERLSETLAAAELDANGLFRVRTEHYAELEQQEIESIIAAHGYFVAKRTRLGQGESLLLTKVGDAAVHVRHIPAVGRVSVGQYRDTPGVAEYAEGLARERGADPLADTELDRVLAREAHWEKRSTRALVMLVLGVCIGPAVLLVDLRDGAATIAGMVVGVAACFVAIVGILLYFWAKRECRAEIGCELDTYRHMAELYRQRDGQRGIDPAR